MTDTRSFEDIADAALAAVENYTGTAAEYETVLAPLLAVDDAMWRSDIHVPLVVRNPLEMRERLFMQRFGGKAVSLNDLLAIGVQTFVRDVLNGNKTAQARAADKKIVIIKKSWRFLPPGRGAVVTSGDGEGEDKFAAPRFDTQFTDVITWLTQQTFNGQPLGLDQMVIYQGTVTPGQMRDEQGAYGLIDLPTLGLKILSSNQIGEGLYIVLGDLEPFDFTLLTKEEIKAKYGAVLVKRGDDFFGRLLIQITEYLTNNTVIPQAAQKNLEAAKTSARSELGFFTEEMRQKIRAQVERTGIGLAGIANRLNKINLATPTLRATIVDGWLTKHTTAERGYAYKRCNLNDYNIIYNYYFTLPDAQPKLTEDFIWLKILGTVSKV